LARRAIFGLLTSTTLLDSASATNEPTKISALN
jgi:hypothetical protein